MFRLQTTRAQVESPFLARSQRYKPFLGDNTAASPDLRRVVLTHDQRSYRSFAAVAHPSEASSPSVASMTAALHPAVLPGTRPDFPIPADKLIKLAQKTVIDDEIGKHNPDLLTDDFRFEFPIVKLSKKEYLKAVRSFDFKAAFPNFAQNLYDWRVDKFEPQRVWFTSRVTGTHEADLKIFDKYSYKPTGREVYGAPEALSVTFDEQGKVTSFTGGYVIDNRLGNTNKLGALLGILNGIGAYLIPHPQPGTLGWKVGCVVDSAVHLVKSALHFLTFNIFKGGKPKQA